MRPFLSRTVASVFALSAVSAPAMAEITAAELLAQWQETFAEAEHALEFDTREDTGTGIRLTEMSTAFSLDDDVKMRITAPEVLLTEMDGRVKVDLPQDIVMSIGDGGDEVSGRFVHDGLDLSVGEADGTRDYIYNAATAEFILDTITEDGEALPVEVSVLLDALSSVYTISDDLLTTNYTLGMLTIDVAAENPDAVPTPETFSLSYEMSGIAGESASDPMMLFNSDDPAALFASGSETSGTLVHTGSGYTFDLQSNEATALVDGSSAGGAYSVSVGPEGIAYDIAGQEVKMRYQGDQLPFPVEASLDSFGLDIGMPLLASEETQPFSFLISLGGLEVSQGIWNLFDPSEVLPRDPGDLVIDIAGDLMVGEDLIEADPTMGPPPVMPTQVTLNELLIDVVGARLTGDGAFDIDFTKPGLAPGAPNAVGRLGLQLLGANQLIDRLVQIGILQPQDVAGIRMMMGMAARPGDEPDSLVSEIELTPNGELIANGMRLQ